MKRVIRNRRLTPEEAAKYKQVRSQIEQELPDLVARHHERMAAPDQLQLLIRTAASAAMSEGIRQECSNMALRNKPCAYCGTRDIPREKGHVIPVSMYPTDTDSRIQRPTVPECTECKKLWQDAENQFRNILVTGGTPNAAVMEQWEGPVRRSFDKASGRRWLMDLVDQMVPIETVDGPRFMIYPARDPRVAVVLRKIVRGLCHYHEIGTAIPDKYIWVDVLRYPMPPELRLDMHWFNLGLKFLEYGYEPTNDRENNIHSAWYFKFYEQREFVALVTFSEESGLRDEGPLKTLDSC